MALIKCRECGKEMSSNAWKCMNCGASLPSEGLRTAYLVLFGLLALIAIVMAIAS